MILTCPACQTRYLVPDAAIGATGRQVRCANCRHSWYEEAPATLFEGAGAAHGSPQLPEPPPSGAARHLAQEETPAVSAPDADPFAPEPPFRPRRNPARMWTIFSVALALLLVAGIAVLLTFGNLLSGTGTAPLSIAVLRKPEVQRLASGVELYTVAGRITNPTDSAQPVPDIRAELRDGQDRTVYSWTIAAPVPRLRAGASAEFNAAEANVPKTARMLRLSFAERVDR